MQDPLLVICVVCVHVSRIAVAQKQISQFQSQDRDEVSFFLKFLFFLKLPFGFFGSFSSSSAVLDHIPESVSSAKNDCTSALLDKTENVSQ